jgi:hypothetical protein
LTAHQAQLQQSLSENAGEALANAASVRQLAERLRQAASGQEQTGGEQGGNEQGGNDQGGHDQTGGEKGHDQTKGNPSGKGQPGNTQTGNAEPGKGQPGSNQPGKAMDQRATDPVNGDPGQPDTAGEQQPAGDAGQILGDAATQQALAMAQRMHAQSRSQPAAPRSGQPGLVQEKQPSEPTGQPSGGTTPNMAGARPGGIVAGAVPLGSDPRSRAKFYQLPPRMRGPLLEGMQERGPEGYQSMIDAYFRELNKEIK